VWRTSCTESPGQASRCRPVVVPAKRLNIVAFLNSDYEVACGKARGSQYSLRVLDSERRQRKRWPMQDSLANRFCETWAVPASSR
jgi:hypothetical protein